MPPMPREAVLMGDFNAAPDSKEYERIVGPSSERSGRLSNPEGLFDGWVAAGHGEREGATCKHGTRIDYIFLSATLRERVREAWIDQRACGSDHQPIGLELEI